MTNLMTHTLWEELAAFVLITLDISCEVNYGNNQFFGLATSTIFPMLGMQTKTATFLARAHKNLQRGYNSFIISKWVNHKWWHYSLITACILPFQTRGCFFFNGWKYYQQISTKVTEFWEVDHTWLPSLTSEIRGLLWALLDPLNMIVSWEQTWWGFFPHSKLLCELQNPILLWESDVEMLQTPTKTAPSYPL